MVPQGPPDGALGPKMDPQAPQKTPQAPPKTPKEPPRTYYELKLKPRRSKRAIQGPEIQENEAPKTPDAQTQA